MSNKTRNIFFLFGLLSIIVMILTFDVSFTQMWEHLRHAGYWLLPIFGMWLLLYMLNTATWRIIIKGSGDCPISFLRLLKITITGFALNYATPCGLMGGEPYKIMELTPHIGRERATSSVLLFAMMHIFAHFWYWLTAAVLYLLFVPIDTRMSIILPLMALFCIAGIYLFTKGYRHGIVTKCISWIGHIPGLKGWVSHFLDNHHSELENIDHQIAHLHSQEKGNFYRSFALEYFGRLCHSVEIMLCLCILGISGTPLQLYFDSLLILSFTSLFANLLFFMPLQLGGREGGFAMSCILVIGPLVGTNQAMTTAIFISIICRVREILWTLIGLLLMKIKT